MYDSKFLNAGVDAKNTYTDGEPEIDVKAVKERVGDRIVLVVNLENINKFLFDSPVWLLVRVAGYRPKITPKLENEKQGLRNFAEFN